MQKSFPKLKHKKLDEFSTLLLIKLAQLVDKQLDDSAQLYKSIEQCLIRETKQTIFCQEVEKIKKKLKKHKKHKKKKDKENNDKIKILKSVQKMYRKKFKQSYETIFYNVWIKILQKTYEFSQSELKKDQSKINRPNERKILVKKKLLSFNRLQRLNHVLRTIFQGKSMSSKYKTVKKRIIRFIKVYEKIQKAFHPREKANLVLKTIMMEILMPNSEDETSKTIEQTQNEQSQQDMINLYQIVEDEILRRFIPNLPQKQILEDMQSTAHIMSERNDSKIEFEYENICRESSSLSLRPLTKKKSIKSNQPLKKNEPKKIDTKKIQEQKSGIYFGTQKNGNNNSQQKPSISKPIIPQKPITTYSDYYKQFNEKIFKIAYQRDYINNTLIYPSIEDDEGRQRAYRQSMKWKVKSFEPNRLTHLSYFYVKSYFSQEDLDDDEKPQQVQQVKFLQKPKKSYYEDEVQQVQNPNKFEYRNKEELSKRHKSIKMSNGNNDKVNDSIEIYSENMKSSRVSDRSFLNNEESKMMKKKIKQRYKAMSDPIVFLRNKNDDLMAEQNDMDETQ